MLHWESNPCLSHMVDQSSPQALVHVLHACTIPTYRRSTIFHCDLIFVPAGRGKNENSGTVMHFLDQNLKIKTVNN